MSLVQARALGIGNTKASGGGGLAVHRSAYQQYPAGVGTGSMTLARADWTTSSQGGGTGAPSAGDRLIVVAHIDDANATGDTFTGIATPSGWTLKASSLQTSAEFYVFEKASAAGSSADDATFSDSSLATANINNSDTFFTTLMAFAVSGSSTSTYTSVTYAASGTTLAIPSVGSAGNLELEFWATGIARTRTLPGTTTGDQPASGGTSASYQSGHETLVSAGTRTLTWSSNPGRQFCVGVALS